MWRTVVNFPSKSQSFLMSAIIFGSDLLFYIFKRFGEKRRDDISPTCRYVCRLANCLNRPEAKFLVRWQGHLRLVSCLSQLAYKLFRWILSWAWTEIIVQQSSFASHSQLVTNSFTVDQEYHTSSYLSRSLLMPSSFISHSQMTCNSVWFTSFNLSGHST
jgi:hypothetical protein